MTGRRVVVTNDDGVGTVGIEAVTLALVEAGHQVTVVAPDGERSGAGTGLGRLRRGDQVAWVRRELPGVETIAVAGTPAMCVMMALEGLVGAPPDVVVSGINHGPNLGYAVLHSGTVGAALTAHIAGVAALAISVGEPTAGLHGVSLAGDDLVWRRAARVGVTLIDLVDDWGRRWVPNVNVPSGWDGTAVTCARLAPVGAIGLTVEDGGGGESATVTLRSLDDLLEDDDASARWPEDLRINARGGATLTPLSGIGWRGDDTGAVESLAGALGSTDAVDAGHRRNEG